MEWMLLQDLRKDPRKGKVDGEERKEERHLKRAATFPGKNSIFVDEVTSLQRRTTDTQGSLQ